MSIRYNGNYTPLATATPVSDAFYPLNFTWDSMGGLPEPAIVNPYASLDNIGAVKINSFSSNRITMLNTDFTLTDGKLRCRLRVGSSGDYFSINLRSTALKASAQGVLPTDGYTFFYQPNIGLARIYKEAVPNNSLLASETVATADYTDFYMTIECIGSTINCYVDDNFVLTATDTTYTSGGFSFFAYDAVTHFGEVTVDNLVKPSI